MFSDIIWRFLILETFVMEALCIFCVPEPTQKKFCQSEFVLEVKIHEDIYLSVGSRFRMDISNIIKGNVDELNIMDHRYVNVEMPIPLTLLARKTHFMFDKHNVWIVWNRVFDDVHICRNKNGRIYADICGIFTWEYTTIIQRLGLVEFYKSGCDCIDEIGSYTKKTHCYWYYSYIKRDDEYHCNWHKTRLLDSCQNRI